MRADWRLTASQKMDARRALELIEGTGFTLEEVARRAIAGTHAGKRIGFVEAHDLFIRSRMTGGARQATVDWYLAKLQPFRTQWAGRTIDAISRAEIRERLTKLPVAESTRAGYSRALAALWHWCAAQEPPFVGADVTHGLRMSPPRGHTAGRRSFLGIAAVRQILTAHASYRNGYAAQFFAGLRPEELAGQDKPWLLHEHVHAAERFIRVPDEIAKTGKGRIVQNLPAAFWAWYRPGAPKAPVSPILASSLRKHAARVLGAALPYDGFRHTFITYAVAMTGDAGKVSLWVGHEGKTSLIFTTYMGLVTTAVAKGYWALRPEA